MFVPTWYDPPSGWKYGFPKAWPLNLERTSENIAKQLLEDGYPKSEIAWAVNHTRFGGIFK